MNNKQVDKPKAILHGECIAFQSVLPDSVRKYEKLNSKPYIIVADSETTGNHHVVEDGEGVEFFVDENQTLFMTNAKPTNIKCLHADRHDSIELEPGTWQFGSQQEYDYFTQELRNVAD